MRRLASTAPVNWKHFLCSDCASNKATATPAFKAFVFDFHFTHKKD